MLLVSVPNHQGDAANLVPRPSENPLKMSSNTVFQSLKFSMLAPGTGFSRPYFYTPNPVRINASAMEVMTDLRFVPAATCQTDMSVAAARQKMIARGVRLLLVVDDNGDVLGLITARDLDGSRVQQAMGDSNLGTNELKVADVMTSGIEVLPLEAVLHAHVGDIVATLKHSGRQHALVADEDPITQKPMVRGVFSASQIARQLGIVTGQNDLSETFAQIDQAINAGLAGDQA